MGKIINMDNYRTEKTEIEIKQYEERIKRYRKTADIEDYMLLKAKYYFDREFYNYIISTEPDIDYASALGMGFAIAESQYENSDIIQGFIAESMLKEIFDKIDNLEEVLHNSYKSKEELVDSEMENYIIDVAAANDENLSFYLSEHPELLKEQKNSINRIINKWDNYDNELKERTTSSGIMNMVDEFIDLHEDCNYDSQDMAIYLKYKLGIDIMDIYEEEVLELDIPTLEVDPFDSEENYKRLFENIDLNTQKMLSDFNIIIRNYMRGDEMPDSYTFKTYIKEERQKIKSKRKQQNKYE